MRARRAVRVDTSDARATSFFAARSADTIVVFGRVTARLGVPVPGANITTAWHAAAEPDTWHDAGVYHDTGTDGLFFTCQAALGDSASSSLRVRVRVDDRQVGETTVPVHIPLTVVPIRLGDPRHQ